MEDFGSRLQPELTAANVGGALRPGPLDAITGYAAARRLRRPAGLDAAWTTQELELMPTWFLQRHLGLDPGCGDWDVLELAFRRILDALAQQPQRFMHRDFHSRNLMLLADGDLGVIDFQGAMRGPCTYDAVSCCATAASPGHGARGRLGRRPAQTPRRHQACRPAG